MSGRERGLLKAVDVTSIIDELQNLVIEEQNAVTELQNILAVLSVGGGSILAKTIRWGKNLEPTWIHAAQQTAPPATTVLVTHTVTATLSGYIYGFLISTQEANNFLLNWTSGGTAYSIRLVFANPGSVECVDPTPLNEGYPADAGSTITITNVTAGAAGQIYQARLLIGEI